MVHMPKWENFPWVASTQYHRSRDIQRFNRHGRGSLTRYGRVLKYSKHKK
jgi:hypothetical protein